MRRLVGAVCASIFVSTLTACLVAPHSRFARYSLVSLAARSTVPHSYCAPSHCALQYTMNVSSRGSEGLFSSLASAPLFSVKLVVGAMSGVLLSDYCPSYGSCDGRHLWSIVGATSLLSPILMIFLRSCIESRESEDRGDVEDAPARVAAAKAKGKAKAAATAAPAGSGSSRAPAVPEALALLPRSRDYLPPTAGTGRVGGAAAAQGKAVVAQKSRPMAIPDEP